MDTRVVRAVKRVAAGLLLAGGLGGCVYAPPYAAVDPYYSYPGYAYPTYVGPPVSLNFGYGYYEHRHSSRYHGKHHGWRSHGWGGHRGWGHRGGGWGHGGRRH